MSELLRLLPPIRRMRGNRLYAADGRRFLDLWLDDSRGILGHRDRLARTAAANAADKGLLRPYPGLYDARLAKSVSSAWPGFGTVRAFESDERAVQAAGRVAARIEAQSSGSSSIQVGGQRREPYLARPFAPVPDGLDLVMPRLPCPRPFAPACLAARDGSPAAQALAAEPGDLVSAQACLAAARGLASLGSAAADGYDETLWKRFDRRMAAFFEREGPYLRARVPSERYEAFFRAALTGGALVSPEPGSPSVVPPEFDDGELVKLARSLESSL